MDAFFIIIFALALALFLWIPLDDRRDARRRRIQSGEFVRRCYPENKELAARVAEVLSEQIAVEIERFEPTSRLLEDFAMDEEVEWLELEMALNEELAIEIELSPSAELSTVDDLIRHASLAHAKAHPR